MMQYEKTHNELANWWLNKEQRSPLLFMTALKEHHLPIADTENLHKYWTDVDFIMERDMQRIDNTNYYGVALPYHYINFSSSAFPCTLGGEIEYVSKNTVWSHPVFEDIQDIKSVRPSKENIAHYTVMETMSRSAKQAKGHHYLGTWSLGGVFDAISGLYSSERLLVDMISNPAAVKEAAEHIQKIWLDEYEKMNSLVEKTGNKGYICDWLKIWSPGRTYPVQEEFAAMISPEMFAEFCLPLLERQIEKIDYPMFLLDGSAMVNHLEMIINIDKLKAIKWQPDADNKRLSQSYDVIKKILGAGKSCLLTADADEIEPLIDEVGPNGLLIEVRDVSNHQAKEMLDKYSL